MTGRGGACPTPPVLWHYCRQIMTNLAAVDSVDIQILVDNVTDSLSSVPSFVETELAGLGRRRGAAWVLGGGCLCCAAHTRVDAKEKRGSPAGERIAKEVTCHGSLSTRNCAALHCFSRRGAWNQWQTCATPPRRRPF